MILALLALLGLAACQLHHSEELAQGKYSLQWGVNNGTLDIKVVVATTGWVAFGFSPNGGMAGSDIVMGWINADGSKSFSDRHTSVNDVPVVDAKQNYELLELSEANGKTTMHFRRAVSSCDEKDSLLVGTARVIYAWGVDKPVNGVPAKHLDANRGTRSVNILNNAPLGAPPTESDASSLVYGFNSTVVAGGPRTRYIVKAFKLPINEKTHFVGSEVVIPPSELAQTHHLLVYLCNSPFNDTDIQYVGLKHSAPRSFRRCDFSRPIAAWAVGGLPVWLPKDVGIPVGQDDTQRYIMLELHLDVVDAAAAVTTNVAIKMHFTKQLRPLDGAVVTFGASVDEFLMVAPNTPKALRRGYCAPECTNSSSSDLQIFGSFLHAHTAGVEIVAQHIDASGTENEPLGFDHHYDFNLQQYSWLPKPRVFKRGDTVVVTCTYNTTGRTVVTVGGESTSQEMCLVYAIVAPLAPNNTVGFSVCGSTGTDLVVAGLLQADAFSGKQLTPNAPIDAFLASVTDWSKFEPAFTATYASSLATVQPFCLKPAGNNAYPSARPASAWTPKSPYSAPVTCPIDLTSQATTTAATTTAVAPTTTTTATAATTTASAVDPTSTAAATTTTAVVTPSSECSDSECCKKLEQAARPCSECAATKGCTFFGLFNSNVLSAGGKCVFLANTTTTPVSHTRINSALECADLCQDRECDACIGDPSQPEKKGVAGCVWCDSGRASLGVSTGSCELAKCPLGDIVQQKTCSSASSVAGSLLVALLAVVTTAAF